MKTWWKYAAKIGLFCLLQMGAGGISVSAQVTQGQPGQTISGDYAVIVNTNITQAQSTGTLVFDASGNGTNAVDEQAAERFSEPGISGFTAGARVLASASVSYRVGEEKYIYQKYGTGKTYVCIGEGEHCYIWMEKTLKAGYDTAGTTEAVAADMAATYDGKPFETLNQMAGGSIPCQDGSGKLSILLETLTGASGVYRHDEGITAIHIHTPPASSYQAGTMSARNGLLVHEGQHALFHLMAQSSKDQPYLWLNEGISVAAMDYLWGGTDSNGWMDGIAGNADIRSGSALFYASYRDSTARDYGMPYLFVRYLIAQTADGYQPMELLPHFYQVSAQCSPDVYLEQVLERAGSKVRFEDLLTQFYTAIIAREADGAYGFSGDSVADRKAENYPLYHGVSGRAHSLAPTAAIAVRLENGSFTVPQDGGADIRYMIISGQRSVPTPAGDGSSENPYQISSFRDLTLMGNKPGAHYKLTKDIQADGQIHLPAAYFSGALDGDGHTIRGLAAPLMGKNSGTIQNLTVEAAFDGEFTGTQGVFAQVNSGIIKDCTALGTAKVRMLRGQSSFLYPAFGVFAGENEVAGTIRGCESAMEVSITLPPAQSYIGGIAGIQTGVVKNCAAASAIFVTQPDGGSKVYAGGIAGKLESMGMGGLLSCCLHTGSILVTGGTPFIGQLCGLADASVVNSGLGAHIVACRAKAGNVPAVGSPTGKLPEDEILLTDEQIGDEAYYKDWNFGSDWKMQTDGPKRLSADDITLLGTVNTPVSCYVGEIPYNWGYVTVNGVKGAAITADMVKGFDSSTEGIRTVRVIYLGKTAAFPVEVKRPQTVADLKISKLAKQTYASGEMFDPSGVRLAATIDGYASRILYSGFECDKKTPLTLADTKVTFSYYGASVTADIRVEEKKASSLTVLNNLGTTLYLAGQKLDLADVRVQLGYNNGERSAAFGADEFNAYGICVVKALSGSCQAVQPGQPLTMEDDGAVVYLCANSILPGEAGAVAGRIGKLTVKEPLHISETVLHMAAGGGNQWITAYVQGGSGDSVSRNYETKVISEMLPPGVVRTKLPDSGYSYFEYKGTPTGQAGSYTSVYLIKDTGTGEGLTAELTIEVHPSNEAKFFRFDLLASQNPGLLKDIVGEIGENEIILRVPQGTDVTALAPAIDFGYAMGTSLPSGYWNGSRHDFTNPVVYTLTAPDGVTVKAYTVRVEYIPAAGGEETDVPEVETEAPPKKDEGGGETEAPSKKDEGEVDTEVPDDGADSGASGESNNGADGKDTGNCNGGSVGTDTEEHAGGDGKDTGDHNAGADSAGSGNPGSGDAGNVQTQQEHHGGPAAPVPEKQGQTGQPENPTPEKPDSSVKPAKSAGYPAVGTIIGQGGAYYRITASSRAACTAELYRPMNKKKTSLKIAAAVRLGGHTYAVTSIAAKAFKNSRFLKQLTIGKNVVSIGNQAFANCTALKKAEIGKSVRTIGVRAFYGCKNLKTITVKSKILKKVGSGAVKGIHARAVIRVPSKKRTAYRKLFQRAVSGGMGN